MSDVSLAGETIYKMVMLDPSEYTVAWIAPLEIEARAALHLLDKRHRGRFPVSRGDDYVFHAGDMAGHNVVIATLPAGQVYGTGSAAALASQLKKFFPNLWIGLLVGVAAGLPQLSGTPPRDIRLGDVLVGLPDGDSAGLIAYDLGKETDDGFQQLRHGHALAMTEPIVRSAIGSIKLESPNDAKIFLPYFEKIRDSEHANGTFADPGQDCDLFYLVEEDGSEKLAERNRRADTRRTRVWYGPIGSGDKLLKNAKRRNELRDKYGLIGLEMEAAGTTDRIPVGVVRGVCDYGDRHKNDQWQPYAAAMAASYARALLDEIPPQNSSKDLSREQRQNQIFSVPFAENKDFVGRENEINWLMQALSDAKKICIALFGMGGAGKTQVALKVAYLMKSRAKDCSVFWLPAFSMAGFEQACTDLVKKLKLPSGPDDEPKEQFREHLNSDHIGRWLIILDNADDEDVLNRSEVSLGIFAYLPRRQAGQVLVTTRWRKIAVEFARTSAFNMMEMGPADAMSLLQASVIHEHQTWNADAAQALLHTLTYLPLAIAQAAAYVNIWDISIEEYLRLCRSSYQDMMELMSSEFQDETFYEESQCAVATTWLVSIKQLIKQSPSAARLLYFIMWIEPQAIPQSILPDVGSEQEFTKAIGLLKSYGFLRARPEQGMFDMHRLVHLVMQSWAHQQGMDAETRAEMMDHICNTFRTDKWESREIWRPQLSHVLHVFETNQGEMSFHISHLGYWAARCLFQEGRIKETILVLQHVRKIEESTLDESHPDRLASQLELARAYQADSQIPEALSLLQHVVKIRETTLDESHPDRLASQHELARAYQADSQIPEALSLLQHVVKIQETTLDENHPGRLASQHQLAIAYQANSQIPEALSLLQHVVKIQETTLDEDHPDQLVSQHQLAGLYLANSQIPEALSLLQHVVKIQETTLDENHPDRLASQHQLAIAYEADGQIQKAISLLQRVVKVKETTLDEDHPGRLASQHALAIAYLANSQIMEAVALLM